MASSAEEMLFRDDETAFTPIRWERTAMEWRDLIVSPFCDLTPAQKLVLIAMCLYGKKWGDDIFPAQREIAFRAGVSPQCVNGTMKTAEREGWIIRHMKSNGQGYKRTVYELAIPAGIHDATALLKARFWQPPYKYKLVKHKTGFSLAPRFPTCST
jgi:hypothetical protein